MLRKGQIKLAGVLSLLLPLIAISSAAAQSFEPVFEWINRFQEGAEIELRVHVNTNSFTFLRSRASGIDRTTFQRLLPKDTPPQQLKILPDKTGKKLEGLVIRYEVNKKLRLEETWKEDQSKAWKKIDFIQLASYPLAQWPNFVKQAVSRNLMEYETIEDEGDLYVFLTFKQAGPSDLRFGKRLLRFSDTFYEHMRISKEFQPWTGSADKFAILVHEPHWSLAGQYQLISGLREFLDANSQYEFRFLVEGYFTEETKYVPTSPLVKRFSSDVSIATQVFALLTNALIDGPFAYRLLYAPDLPAVAIDDPGLIKQTLPEQEVADWIETSGVLTKTDEKLQEMSTNESSQVRLVLIVLSYYAQADREELRGQALIDCQLQLAELFDALAKCLRILRSGDFTSEISFFDTQSQAYRTNAKRYQSALKRDATMAKNVLKHFVTKEHGERIPMVFIGNFHTPALTSYLRSEGMGYVVIEPRASVMATSESERQNFNAALDLNARPAYLRRLAGDLKLPVAPTEAELPYYESFLKRRAIPRSKTQEAHFHQSFQALGPNKVDLASLSETLRASGFLSNVQVSFAGGDMTPPPPFQRAFASLHFDPEGKPSELALFQPRDSGWARQDRYRFLQKASLSIPYLRKQTRRARFDQDPTTKRVFGSFFDPESQILYMFEGDRVDVFNLLPLPKRKGEEETLIHMRLSILDFIAYNAEKRYG